METHYCTLDEVDSVTGTVVVIDVLRAYTTAAVALDAGARRYQLVRTTEEAFARRAASSDVRVMGEVDGRRPDGFDFSNSPAELSGVRLDGLDVVHRSSAGTQGAVLATAADQVWAASFAVAGATAAAVHASSPDRVTFCITGASMGRDGDEDRACGQLIATLLTSGPVTDPRPWTDRVDGSSAGRTFLTDVRPDLDPADLDFAKVVDRFGFAMRVRHTRGGVWLEAHDPAVLT